MDDASRFRFKANTGDAELALVASLAKPFVIHGQNGVSQKAEGAGHASHYYSATRLATTGTLKIKGQEIEVKGESWLDREWASNQLTSEQVGWDWFSVQFDDGTELMLYQMRRRDGSVDLASSGTWIPADGEATHLSRDACRLRPLEHWKSTATAGRYPVAWDVEVPSLQLRVRVTTPMKEQELALKPIAYWEGMIDASGARAGKPLRGRGYMELTGYAGALVGLSSGSR
jgi:predicted secreted hydrolase